MRPDSIGLITRLVEHLDEPFADSSAIPTFVVSEFTAQHVKVALSGDGGDELFGGYTSFFQVDRLRRYDHVPQAARKFLSWIADRLPYSAYGKNYLRAISRPSALERYFEATYMPYFLRRQLLSPECMLPADAGFLARACAASLPGNGASPLTQAMYFEATSKLTGDILVKVDRMSMANSLEVRCPLLDHELAEFAAAIPHRAKIRHGSGKHILLEALGDRLPPALLDRPKRGFGVPLAAWFRGELREFLQDHLLSSGLRERRIVSETFLRTLLEEHGRGRRDNSHWLWHVLMIELWFRNLERA